MFRQTSSLVYVEIEIWTGFGTDLEEFQGLQELRRFSWINVDPAGKMMASDDKTWAGYAKFLLFLIYKLWEIMAKTLSDSERNIKPALIGVFYINIDRLVPLIGHSFYLFLLWYTYLLTYSAKRLMIKTQTTGQLTFCSHKTSVFLRWCSSQPTAHSEDPDATLNSWIHK